MQSLDIHAVVKDKYSQIAKRGGGCCSSCCCQEAAVNPAAAAAENIGYSSEQLESVPEGANLGLGCGNPTAYAFIKEGDTVLDLGSGAGFDAFLAAKKTGDKGKVIGVDMTEEMIQKARSNAEKGGFNNVEFRLGQIENLPVEDNSVDVIISNCVINLSPCKETVFKEAYRVLKPEGRLLVSDIVLLGQLPESIKNSMESYTGCIAGAMLKDDYISAVKNAGFQQVNVEKETPFTTITMDLQGLNIIPKEIVQDASRLVSSINLSAVKE